MSAHGITNMFHAGESPNYISFNIMQINIISAVCMPKRTSHACLICMFNMHVEFKFTVKHNYLLFVSA